MCLRLWLCLHYARFYGEISALVLALMLALVLASLVKIRLKDLRWFLLPAAYVLICLNSIPGTTGVYVAGWSAAYENQA